MKKIFIALFISTLFTLPSFSQSVPQGMKYQAVARDLEGNVLANKEIQLQINLNAMDMEKARVYSESHKIMTNELGLFSLTIGEGNTETGTFKSVPWSTSDIWMEIRIRENEESEFLTISNSKILSVPYAFHAATAGQLLEKSGGSRGGDNGNGNDPGVPSQNWSLFGNSNSDPDKDFLGTTDLADLVIITNNIERMRIYEDGDINIVNSLNIGKDLTVQENTYLNATTGQTINYGPFTVENQSPTLLSGTLTVDQATDLNASLNVDGVTDLNSALNVNNGSPTLLTGILTVEDDATFEERVAITSGYQSTSTTTGSLVTGGGVGIGKNLNVGGSSTFEGPVDFNSPVTINATDESTSTGNGALIVAGGVGIGKRLNLGGAADMMSTLNVDGATTLGSTLGVTGATSLSSTLTVAGASQLNNTLGVTGITSITNSTSSGNSSSGALVVTGGAGIGGNLNVGGSFNVTKDAGTGHVASFVNTGNGNGISIKVGAPVPHNNNNFITFLNSNGGTVGRIEGENGSADLANNREYQDDRDFKITDIALSTTGELIAIGEEIQAIVAVTASATSSTACVGLGACVTAPIPSFIVSSAADLILQTANLVLQTADLASVIANLVVFEDTHEALFGITFASGSEDYAEYLPKLNPDAKFLPGDVVGVKNGFISKNTDGADRIMVISHKPVVLGGLPPDLDVSDYEMVAFMGQVPTRILGMVNPGDYILPSGYHNGFGVAKNPKSMRPQDYKKVLGIAWEGNNKMDIALVNTAIGLNSNDLADVVMQQAEKIDEQQMQINFLQNQMSQTQHLLAELVPGYAKAANISPTKGSEDDHLREGGEIAGEHLHELMVEPGPDQIIYLPVTEEHLEAAYKQVEEAYTRRGVDLSKHPFFNRMDNEPSYKEEVFADIKTKLKHSVHTHQQINLEFNGGK